MSASVISTDSDVMVTGVASVITTLKDLSHTDLLKVMKALTTELGKKSKELVKDAKASKVTTKAKKEPKEKKPLPKHLKKPHAWVAFTLKNALENGWAEFVIHQKRKNKDTGVTEEEEIVMPKAVLNDDGAWVYEGTIGSEKNPSGKQLNHKEAMSLSKVLKDSGDKSWSDFEAQYVEEDDDSDVKSVAESEASKKSNVVRKTIAEKEAEKEAEKAAAKAAKDAEKAAKKTEKVTAKAEEKKLVPSKKADEEPKVDELKKVVTKKVIAKK